MKVHFLLLSVPLFFVGCDATKSPNDAGQPAPDWSSYGEDIPEDAATFAVKDAAAMIAESGSAAGIFEAEIVQSCQTMGCWMTVKGTEDEAVRVFMKNHAFFVPKDSVQGKKSYFYGEAFYDTISVDLQKHLLEDAGATAAEIEAVTEPVYELAFEAAGVMIADVPAGAPMAGDE
ncbi:MAG: DUF4920 domain-containing protein [Flavobacteriales bacterium]|nr:DUF4920 domain-containing protein [Flavobacteriales bacterium]